jgi:hypothetical protein
MRRLWPAFGLSATEKKPAYHHGYQAQWTFIMVTVAKSRLHIARMGEVKNR